MKTIFYSLNKSQDSTEYVYFKLNCITCVIRKYYHNHLYTNLHSMFLPSDGFKIFFIVNSNKSVTLHKIILLVKKNYRTI